MQTRCSIQATGQNNGDKLRNYTKSSNRSESPLIYVNGSHLSLAILRKESVRSLISHSLYFIAFSNSSFMTSTPGKPVIR